MLSRPSRALVAPLGLAVCVACGDDEGTRPPDGSTFSFSFEDGLGDWRPDSADFCTAELVAGECPAGSAFAPSDVEVVTGTASDGQRAVRLFAENDTDAVKVWIERPFDVEPGTWEVTVSFDVGTRDLPIGAWTIIGAATATDPTAAADRTPPGVEDRIGEFLRLGEAISDDGSLTFVRFSFRQTVSGESVWVAIGIWGTFEVGREFFLDDVVVEIGPAG